MQNECKAGICVSSVPPYRASVLVVLSVRLFYLLLLGTLRIYLLISMEYGVGQHRQRQTSSWVPPTKRINFWRRRARVHGTSCQEFLRPGSYLNNFQPLSLD